MLSCHLTKLFFQGQTFYLVSAWLLPSRIWEKRKKVQDWDWDLLKIISALATSLLANMAPTLRALFTRVPFFEGLHLTGCEHCQNAGDLQAKLLDHSAESTFTVWTALQSHRFCVPWKFASAECCPKSTILLVHKGAHWTSLIYWLKINCKNFIIITSPPGTNKISWIEYIGKNFILISL